MPVYHKVVQFDGTTYLATAKHNDNNLVVTSSMNIISTITSIYQINVQIYNVNMNKLQVLGRKGSKA